MGRKLGEIRKNLQKRYVDVAKKVEHFTLPDLIVDKVEKTVFSFLTQLGLDFPMDFVTPPPDVEVAARQGTKCLEPQGTVTAATPPVKLDESCLTWRARDGGFLVIDLLDFIMEDPISEEFFELEFKFDEQINDPKRQRDNGVKEPGHWKFNRVVLIDGEVLTVCVRNTNPFAGGCFSWENVNWTL